MCVGGWGGVVVVRSGMGDSLVALSFWEVALPLNPEHSCLATPRMHQYLREREALDAWSRPPQHHLHISAL